MADPTRKSSPHGVAVTGAAPIAARSTCHRRSQAHALNQLLRKIQARRVTGAESFSKPVSWRGSERQAQLLAFLTQSNASVERPQSRFFCSSKPAMATT